MKIYGDLNFDSIGSLVESGIAIESPDTLPTSGVQVGRLSYVNEKLYICTVVTLGVPTWAELTNEVNAFVFTQASASASWVITHNLGVSPPSVQVYNLSGELLIPDSITINDTNTVTVAFSDAQAGTAIVIAGPGSSGGGGGGGGGSAALSSLTSAVANNTLNNGDNLQIWNWALTAPTDVGLLFGESSAAVGGSGTQYLFGIQTLSGSTANPFAVIAGGNNALTINTNGAFLLGSSVDAGTSGQVLTSSGAGAAPSWATPTGGPFPIEKQVATSGQTVFNTAIVDTIADSGNKTYLQVFVNGVYQEQGASQAYTVTAANQVTFNYALSINSNVVFIELE